MGIAETLGARLLRRGALVGAALAFFAASAASAQTVKVGVILTYSGRDAALGEQIDRAINLFVKLHEKDLPAGVKVELIKRDDTGVNPDLAKRLAQELVLRDQVQILTGGQWTPNAMAVAALPRGQDPVRYDDCWRKRRDATIAICRANRLDTVADQLSARRVGGKARLEKCLHRSE